MHGNEEDGRYARCFNIISGPSDDLLVPVLGRFLSQQTEQFQEYR